MARRQQSKIQSLTQLARNTMGQRVTHTERESGYGYYHGMRVAKIAQRLADVVDDKRKIDPEELYAAGLFHDVTKGIEPHEETGAALLVTLLAPYFDKAPLRRIGQMVQEHNMRTGNKRTGLGSRILQDADILDHVGTQSIWLNFQYAARHDEPQKGAYEWATGAKHQKKIKRWREALNFDLSRAIFERRVQYENEFFNTFKRELTGD